MFVFLFFPCLWRWLDLKEGGSVKIRLKRDRVDLSIVHVDTRKEEKLTGNNWYLHWFATAAAVVITPSSNGKADDNTMGSLIVDNVALSF